MSTLGKNLFDKERLMPSLQRAFDIGLVAGVLLLLGFVFYQAQAAGSGTTFLLLVPMVFVGLALTLLGGVAGLVYAILRWKDLKAVIKILYIAAACLMVVLPLMFFMNIS